MSKEYRGVRTGSGNTVVTVRDLPYEDEPRLLNPRLDIADHSVSGILEWGYGGAGPHQLCIALLAEEYPELIQEHYKSKADYYDDAASYWLGEMANGLLRKIVSRIPQKKNWIMTSHDIGRALVEIIVEIRCGEHHNGGNSGEWVIQEDPDGEEDA